MRQQAAEGRKERGPLRTFKETSKIVEEVANIALQAAEEKGLTFREVLYLPEMIDARIKRRLKKGKNHSGEPRSSENRGAPDYSIGFN